MKKSHITVIIPAYNDAEQLDNTIISLLDTRSGHGVDVLVIDDASDVKLNGKVLGAKVIRNRHRLGPGACRDIGLRHCKTDLVLFCDSHMVFGNGWDKIPDHDEKSLISGPYLSLNREKPKITRPDRTFCGAKFFFHKEDDQGCRIFDTDLLPASNPYPVDVSCLVGANYIMYRHRVIELGGFGGLSGWGCDEPLICIKNWLYGGHNVVYAKPLIGHIIQPPPVNRTPKHMILANHLTLAKIFLDNDRYDRFLAVLPKSYVFIQALQSLNIAAIGKAQRIIGKLGTRTMDDYCDAFGIEKIDNVLNRLESRTSAYIAIPINQQTSVVNLSAQSVKPRFVDPQTIINHYAGKSEIQKPKLPASLDPEHWTLTNTPTGLGDSMILTFLPKSVKLNKKHGGLIWTPSVHFARLAKFNPHYVDRQTPYWVSASQLNHNYNLGSGHIIQRLQRSFGLKIEIKPKGCLVVASDRDDDKVALHFEPGDHVSWQQQHVHPRARSLYDGSIEILRQFIKAHPSKTFYAFDRNQAWLRKLYRKLTNVKWCGSHSLGESVQQMAECSTFIGIMSGPMHMAVALGLKCIIIINFPHASQVVLPNLKPLGVIEEQWFYPQNVHLHQESESEMVPRFNAVNLEKAINGEIYPYWSDRYLHLI